MKTLLDRIAIDPNVCNGKPVIKGTRIAVHTVLEFLAAGDSIEDVLQNYPSLELEDIRAAMQFAASIMGNAFSIKAVA